MPHLNLPVIHSCSTCGCFRSCRRRCGLLCDEAGYEAGQVRVVLLEKGGNVLQLLGLWYAQQISGSLCCCHC